MQSPLLALLGIGSILLVSSCTSMKSELKDGTLFSMQDALIAAEKNCTNSNLRIKALDWSIRGVKDLEHRQRFLRQDSDEYYEVRDMLRTLSSITQRRVSNQRTLCDKISSARRATDEFIARNSLSPQLSDGDS